MTVKELIQALEMINDDLEVVVDDKFGRQPATFVSVFLSVDSELKVIIE